MTDEWKPRTGQRIEKLYAWVAEEADGGEGVIAFNDLKTQLGWIPLVGADRDRIESYRWYAEEISAASGRPVRLKMFAAGVVIDSLGRPT